MSVKDRNSDFAKPDKPIGGKTPQELRDGGTIGGGMAGDIGHKDVDDLKDSFRNNKVTGVEKEPEQAEDPDASAKFGLPIWDPWKKKLSKKQQEKAATEAAEKASEDAAHAKLIANDQEAAKDAKIKDMILAANKGLMDALQKAEDDAEEALRLARDLKDDWIPPLIDNVNAVVAATVVVNAPQESHSVGATGDYAGNFNVASIETDTDILERTVDGVLVKEGMSGIYYVTMQIHGKLENTANGASSVEVTFTNDGVPNTRLRWQLIRNLNASVSDINEEIEKEDSASSAIFVDASAADVLLSADWACSVETLSEWDLNAFTVTLLELTDVAIVVAIVP